jgi:hypothetical protein
LRRQPARKRRAPTRQPAAAAIAELLRGYLDRGVFRSLGTPEPRGDCLVFTMVWHHGRTFRLVVRPHQRTVAFPELLPRVPPRSPMMKELRTFLRQFESAEMPSHRRIDPGKGTLHISRNARGVSVSVAVRAGEWVYCTRKLVHLAHEIYLVFLPDGPYQDYRIEKLGLDPDAVWT